MYQPLLPEPEARTVAILIVGVVAVVGGFAALIAASRSGKR